MARFVARDEEQPFVQRQRTEARVLLELLGQMNALAFPLDALAPAENP
ncbi:MAG TPA: hypothetical protein PKE51_09090 [Gemmatimonadaceae bacterium]|nr:hypothetical protein [Gemmatimonadaceae bacterium]